MTQRAQVVPEVVARVHALLPPDWDWSGAAAAPPPAAAAAGGAPAGGGGGAASEEAREAGDLQRAYYALLLALALNQLAPALLQARPRAASRSALKRVLRARLVRAAAGAALRARWRTRQRAAAFCALGACKPAPHGAMPGCGSCVSAALSCMGTDGGARMPGHVQGAGRSAGAARLTAESVWATGACVRQAARPVRCRRSGEDVGAASKPCPPSPALDPCMGSLPQRCDLRCILTTMGFACTRQAPGGTLDVALEGLLRGAAGHVDPAVRRMCLQALRRLLADIAAAPQPPAGFQQCARPRSRAACGVLLLAARVCSPLCVQPAQCRRARTGSIGCESGPPPRPASRGRGRAHVPAWALWTGCSTRSMTPGPGGADSCGSAWRAACAWRRWRRAAWTRATRPSPRCWARRLRCWRSAPGAAATRWCPTCARACCPRCRCRRTCRRAPRGLGAASRRQRMRCQDERSRRVKRDACSRAWLQPTTVAPVPCTPALCASTPQR